MTKVNYFTQISLTIFFTFSQFISLMFFTNVAPSQSGQIYEFPKYSTSFYLFHTCNQQNVTPKNKSNIFLHLPLCYDSPQIPSNSRDCQDSKIV
jgi:hypothetical protein